MMGGQLEVNKTHNYDFSYLKGIDLQSALVRVVHNEKLFVNLLEKFREKYSHSIDDIKKLLEQNRLVEAEAECHKLKGICGNIGANELFEKLQQMDTELLASHSPTNKQLEQSQTSFENILNSIGEFLSHIDHQGRETDSVKNSPLQLKKALQQILNCLESDIGTAIEKFDSFYENFCNQIDKKELDIIKQALYEFNIDGVKQQADVIMKLQDSSSSQRQ